MTAYDKEQNREAVETYVVSVDFLKRTVHERCFARCNAIWIIPI